MIPYNETIIWRQPGGPDFYGPGEPTDAEIRVFWQDQRQLVRASDGSETVSEATVYTKAPVQSGHSLVDANGGEWPVIGVAEIKDITGRVTHREVSL